MNLKTLEYKNYKKKTQKSEHLKYLVLLQKEQGI